MKICGKGFGVHSHLLLHRALKVAAAGEVHNLWKCQLAGEVGGKHTGAVHRYNRMDELIAGHGFVQRIGKVGDAGGDGFGAVKEFHHG